MRALRRAFESLIFLIERAVTAALYPLRLLRERPVGWTESFPPRVRSRVEFLRCEGKEVHYDDLWSSDPVPFSVGITGALLRSVRGLVPWRRVPAAVAASPDPEFRP